MLRCVKAHNAPIPQALHSSGSGPSLLQARPSSPAASTSTRVAIKEVQKTIESVLGLGGSMNHKK